jgi:hypothetical protein
LGYYRSWRSRGWRNSYSPSKYSVLSGLFGDAVKNIRDAFFDFSDDALDELFSDYGEMYGESAERYARNTFPKWKSRSTSLSGQTMERLVELVPPYLSAEQRFSILKAVLKRHKKSVDTRIIRINIKEPSLGFSEIGDALASMKTQDVLANLPERVMKAASWLYDDDITAARAMLADAERLENDIVRASAQREIDLLKRTILTGQVKAANYSVETPAGRLQVVAYTPSKCFVATLCFGENAIQTSILRCWRDSYLMQRVWGRKFIVWYYTNGEKISSFLSAFPLLLFFVRFFIWVFVFAIRINENRSIK